MVTVPIKSYFGLDETGIGGYIVSNRLRGGLWASTNPRNGPNGCTR